MSCLVVDCPHHKPHTHTHTEGTTDLHLNRAGTARSLRVALCSLLLLSAPVFEIAGIPLKAHYARRDLVSPSNPLFSSMPALACDLRTMHKINCR